MRNPDRILKIINLIYEIWTKNPDLRLGQLIANCENQNIYNIEDEELEAKLIKMYGIE